MDTLELIKRRRSIRKYQDREIPEDTLRKIIDAALYAPNAGGAQSTFICAVRGRELCEKIGRLNLARFDRKLAEGCHVSDKQPSIIDDPSIKSSFYGAPAVCVIFAPKDALYGTEDAFCCAAVTTLAAEALGVSSCIVTRAEATFACDEGEALLKKWEIPENLTPRCFVLLGWRDGERPGAKPRRENRWKIVC